MNAIGIIAVKIGKKNDLKIKAGEVTPVIFTFTRPLEKGETVDVKCHAYEKKFDLNYPLEIFTLSTEHKEECRMVILDDPPSCESKPIQITIPEELAGATVNLSFAILRKPSALPFPIYNPLLSFKQVTVEILSGEGEPKIEAIYWSNSKEVKFGKLSTPRKAALIKNETVYLHIHTRGLYGKQVTIKGNNMPIAFPRIVTMRNNVAVEVYTFFDDRINEIKMCCTPFSFNILMEKAVSKSVTIPYIKDEEVVLSTKAMPVLASPHSPKKKDYASEAKCRVDFRPKKDYDGSFGFSWYRVGDMDASTGHIESAEIDTRTHQSFKTNKPCNDHPFSEKDFPGTGILGKHYETVSGADRVVKNGNDSGTGSGNPKINYPKKGTRDNFITDTTMADDHKKDYPKISLSGYTDAELLKKEYLAPVMTLECGKTVELQFFLHIKKTPKKILFVFDNPRVKTDGVLAIKIKSPIVSPAVTTTTPNFAHTIEITCNKKFDKEIRLKAYAIPDSAKDGMVKEENGRLVLYPQEGFPLVLPELCGMMRIIPNDDAHWREIKVVFFNVTTRLDKTKTEKSGLAVPTIPDKSTMSPLLPTAPPQSPFALPAFTPFSPPLLPPAVVEKKGESKEEILLNKYLAQAYVKATIIVKTIDLSSNPSYEKMCVDINGDGILDKFDYNGTNAEDLRKLLVADPSSIEHDKPDHYRLYFVPDEATTVNGYSTPGANFTICFSGATDATPAHELGHTLGLPHTFDGNKDKGAKYTYEDGKTDNIMDYSHRVNIERISFFHWQWESINTNLNK